MINQSVWIGIVVGVFFVGLASGYAILAGYARSSKISAGTNVKSTYALIDVVTT